jgi:hypothetical protein
MPDEVVPDHNDDLASRLSRDLVAAYHESSDEQFGIVFWNGWCAHQLEGLQVQVDGVPLAPIPPAFFVEFLPAFLAAIHIETRKLDTPNEELVGIEKALRLCAEGNYAAAGRLVRQHLRRRAEAQRNADEAATRRRHQAAIGRRKRRSSYLHTRVAEMVEAQHDITTPGVIQRLERLVDQEAHLDPEVFPRIERVDRTEDTSKGAIEWSEPNPRRRGAARCGATLEPQGQEYALNWWTGSISSRISCTTTSLVSIRGN